MQKVLTPEEGSKKKMEAEKKMDGNCERRWRKIVKEIESMGHQGCIIIIGHPVEQSKKQTAF